MAAGKSAFDEAARARAQAARYDDRAAAARRRAERFESGGDGERSLAGELGPLAADGWHFLFDRVNPAGGNIDAIAVGPPGVCVIDNKAWNGRIEVGGGRLKVGGWSKPAVLAASADSIAAVADVLDRNGDDVELVGTITFTTQPLLGPFEIDGQHILGCEHLVEMLRISAGRHSAATVERLHGTLAAAFPPAGTVPSAKSGLVVVDETELGWYLTKTTSLYFTKRWTQFGKDRIYLKDATGTDLGHRDLNRSTSHLERSADDPFAPFLLDHLTVSGLVADKRHVPKVLTDFPMAKVFGRLSKLWRAALVGGEFRGHGKHYLYGAIVHPGEGVLKLGHVDLATGFVKPEHRGELLEGAATAELLLAILRDNRPEVSGR